MRKFIDLIETYSSQNSFLLRTLHDKSFDYYGFWHEICIWADSTGHLDELNEIAGTNFDYEGMQHYEHPEIFEKLPSDVQKEAEEWVINYLNRNDPAELPSQHFFQPEAKLIPRQTWLVHFSDHARDIKKQGFTHGTYSANKLGLTTYYTHEHKASGGYNFAFQAMSRHAAKCADRGSYGKHAVMFQSSGVKAWHYSDEEDQIIFWGPDVDRRSIVLLTMEFGDWSIYDNRYDRKLISGSFEQVEKWVITHFDQYRRVITDQR